jgi:iron-sulfur cluster repair protein YtfE (RIC family)
MPSAQEILAPNAGAKILEAHAALRRLIQTVGPLVRDELAQPGAATRGLRAAGRELAHALRHHIDAEERVLEPVLRGIDAWGTERVERMLEEHVRQRMVIADVLRLAAGRGHDAVKLAHVLATLAAELLVDMDDEEKTILAPLFADDGIIDVEQVDG